MKIVIIVGVLSLAVGSGTAIWLESNRLSRDPQPVEPAVPNASWFDATAPSEERIRALEQAVIEERQARQLLEDEILFLTQEIERLDADSIDSAEEQVSARGQTVRESIRTRRFAGDRSKVRIDRLLEAGFPLGQAEWIVRREAELQMEALRARYEAMRNSDDPRFFGFMPEGDLRAELGEADYERYLAANGRSTVVSIGNVLPNSPAHSAGLRPGDQIVRYDGERVFGMMDVANQIMHGGSEGNVVVDIVRGDLPMQLVMPRGPLGVVGD
ncbi:MAG: PDZ domain-containing protein [Woeseia sp.]